jgi:hypothetical protein
LDTVSAEDDDCEFQDSPGLSSQRYYRIVVLD